MRSREKALARGWRFVWVDDDDADLSWCECHADKTLRHAHEVLGCILADETKYELASLWGITDPDRAYAAEIEEDLASEALRSVEEREAQERASVTCEEESWDGTVLS